MTMRAELDEMKVLVSTLGTTSIPTTTAGAAHTGKRARVHNNVKTTVPKVVITCTVCKKNGHNAHGCWFNAENKLKEAVKMKNDTEDILKSKKTNKKSLMSVFSPNEHNDECLNCVSLKCYRVCADTYVEHESRSLGSLVQGTQGTGSRVQLVGVTGDDIQTEISDVTFPVLTTTNELYVIDTTNSQPGSTLFVDKTKDNIISLTILLKADFKVDFAVGRDDDSCFGGSLYRCEGILIQMVFDDNLCHIPM